MSLSRDDLGKLVSSCILTEFAGHGKFRLSVGHGSAAKCFAGGVLFFVAEPPLPGAAGGFCGFAGDGWCEDVGDEFGESFTAGGVISSLITKTLAGDLQDAFF
ncbi:MAG: hypothetical protein RLZZ458_1431 [Planctomycetota bacterium]